MTAGARTAASAEPATSAPKPQPAPPTPVAGGLQNLEVARHARSGGSLAGLPGAPIDNQQQQSRVRGTSPRRVEAEQLGPSQPLSPAVSAQLSPLFRHDFSSVRVHHEANVASELGARAFTVGNHVAIAPGEPRADSAAGRELIAHELAHVVQQSGSASVVQGSGLGRDGYEAEADAAAAAALAGRPVPRLSSVDAGTIQRQGKPGADDKSGAAPDPKAHPSLTDQYPYLLGLLSETDITALEAASEHRYAKTGATSASADAASAKLAKSVVTVPLDTLLSPEAHYVDVAAWDTVYGVLRGHGAPALVGSLLRNEMMRRFITNNGLSADSPVDIKLVDPDGKTPGPSRLSFEITGTKIPTTMGMITPANLSEALKAYRLDDAIGTVGDEANKVAMEVALLEELEQRNPQVQDRVKDQAADPQSHSPTELRALAMRLDGDKKAALDMAAKAGYVAPGAQDLAATFGQLLDQMNGAVAAQEAWLAEHHTMPSQAEMNEEAGTWLVTQGSKQWDKGGGHYLLSGLAYTGAVGVAIVDGLGNLFSFGYQNDEGQINKAYNRGQISWNERTDLEFAALGRAAAVGIVTIAVTIATAGLGTEAAVGLGLARGTFAYGAVVVGGGALSGTLVSASSLGTKSLITGVGDFQGPGAQAIWKSGMPSATEWKWGLAMGAGFGALGAVPKALPGPAGMVVAGAPRPVGSINVDGFDIDLSHDLAVGTHPDGRVCYIRPSGGGIYNIGPDGLLIPLKEVGEGGVPRSMISPQGAGPVVLDVGPDGTVVPPGAGSTAMVPYQGGGLTAPYAGAANPAAPLVLNLTAGGELPIVWDGKPMLMGPNGIVPPPPPMTFPGATGDEVVSSFLRAKQLSGATAPDADVVNTLMRDYGTTLPAPPEPMPFDLLGFANPQSQLPMLPPGPQPFGLLGAPAPELPYDINPPGSYLPRLGPGAPPNPNFTPEKLGWNIMRSAGLGKDALKSLGMPPPLRNQFLSGWQPHHVLPLEIQNMPQVSDLAIDFDAPSNGLMMPERATFDALVGDPNSAWSIRPHEGYHRYYSTAMKEAVSKIDPALPKSIREIKLYNLQQRARAALQGGAPLYKDDGASLDLWRRLLNPN